jgi:5-methylcytosine-specific restriction endonuclease McrA
MAEFHKSKTWRKVREKILKRDYYLCQICNRHNITREANIVHHIIPIEFNKALRLRESNLISLCNYCHNACHLRSSHELSSLGSSLLKSSENKSPHPHKSILSQ